MLKEKDCHLRILYTAILSFKNEGETKTVPDKQKLEVSVNRKPKLQEIIKRVFQAEMKGH